MAETMHIVLAADDHYAKRLAVTIMSVLCNRTEGDILFFHVLDGGIQPQSRRKILDMVTERGADVEFLPVDQSLFSGKALNIADAGYITQATYYRLLIPSYIQAERCIYMDCDMICRTSLAPLWNTNLGDSIAAAVKDIDEDKHSVRLGLKRYFNAGLFLMDIQSMREEKIQDKFFQFFEEHHDQIVQHDQDVLNCVLHERIQELPMTWNCQVAKVRKCKETGFHDLSRTANILHFIGRRKPWVRGCKVKVRGEYWKYEELIEKSTFWHRIVRFFQGICHGSYLVSHFLCQRVYDK